MMALSESEAVDQIRSLLSQLGSPGARLTDVQTDASLTLADTIASHLHRSAQRCISTNVDETLIFQYMSDGWSCWVHRHRIFSDNCGRHRVQTKHRVEFCLERALLRNCSGSEHSFRHMLVGIARPMLNGKSTEQFFQCYIEFMQHPRLSGHRGVLNEFYSFDGLHHAALMRLIRGRHHTMYSREYGTPELSEAADALILYCTNWVEGMRCVNHAGSAGLKWGLFSLSFPSAVDDWHIVFESVRNTSTELIETIPAFVTMHVSGCEPLGNRYIF